MDKGLVYARAVVAHLKKQGDTPRGAVLFNHLAQLAYLAGIMPIFPAELLAHDNYTSIHDFAGIDLLKRAQKRIVEGIVPEDWDDTLEGFFRAKDVMMERLPS